MYYSIRAYRACLWAPGIVERNKAVVSYDNSLTYEFIDAVDEDSMPETPYYYAQLFGFQEYDFLRDRWGFGDWPKKWGGRRDYIVTIIEVETDEIGNNIGEDSIAACTLTITPAGLMISKFEV